MGCGCSKKQVAIKDAVEPEPLPPTPREVEVEPEPVEPQPPEESLTSEHEEEMQIMFHLSSFMPHSLFFRCLHHPSVPMDFEESPFFGAVLVIDISGFTSLTEMLAEQGKRGVDKLTRHVSTYFGHIIEIVYKYGGDVIRFAGDALIVVFRSPEDVEENPHAMLVPIVAASQCGLEVQKEWGEYIASGIPLSLHVGGAAGMLSELRLGGYQREWFFVVRGEPYSILSTAVDSAGKGEMCLADETVQMLLGKLEHTAKTVKVRVIQSLDLSLGDVEDELVSVVSDSDVGGSSAAVVAPGEGGVQPEGGVTNGEGDDMAALPGPPVLTESDTVADTPVPSSGTTPVTPGGGGGVTEEDGSKLTLPKPSVATMSPGGTAQFEEVTQTTFDKAGVRFRWRQLESGAWKIFESKLLGTCSLKMADPVVIPYTRAHGDVSDSIRAYLPVPIQHRIDAHQDDYINEMRQASVIFISLVADPSSDVTTTKQLHDGVRKAQECMISNGGNILHVLNDEKGTIMVISFGALVAHEDCPQRAVDASIQFQEALQYQPAKAWIGVTYGTVFCGCVGSPLRRDYTVIGDVANLAARLMAASKEFPPGQFDFGGILLDEPTMRACQTKFNFTLLKEVYLKGKKAGIKVYRILELVQSQSARSSGRAREDPFQTLPMVGRDPQLAIVQKVVQEISKKKKGLLQPRYTLLVEGESGSGKSLFLRELIKEAQKKRKVLCFSNISTGAAPTSTSLGAFIRVMQRIFPNPRHVLDDATSMGRSVTKSSLVEGSSNLPSWEETVIETLAETFMHFLRAAMESNQVSAEEAVTLANQWAPLLNDLFLALNIKESSVTKDMPMEERLSNLFWLLRVCTEFHEPDSTLAILMDDWHLLDPLSKTLLASISKHEAIQFAGFNFPSRRQNLMVVVTSLPSSDASVELQPEQKRTKASSSNLLASAGTHLEIMHLEPLDVEDIEVILRHLFELGRLDKIDPMCPSFLNQKSGGNAFFLVKLVKMLKSSGALYVHVDASGMGGRTILKLNQAQASNLPLTVQAMFMSQFDTLPSILQLLVKVASVCGYSFSFDIIFKVFTNMERKTTSREDFCKLLESLMSQGIFVASVNPETGLYDVVGFTNTVMRDTIYDVLLQSQRCALHRSLAETIEVVHGNHLAPFFSELARHWNVVASVLLEAEIPALSALASTGGTGSRGSLGGDSFASGSGSGSGDAGSVPPSRNEMRKQRSGKLSRATSKNNVTDHRQLIRIALQARRFNLLSARQESKVSLRNTLRQLQKGLSYLDTVRLFLNSPETQAQLSAPVDSMSMGSGYISRGSHHEGSFVDSSPGVDLAQAAGMAKQAQGAGEDSSPTLPPVGGSSFSLDITKPSNSTSRSSFSKPGGLDSASSSEGLASVVIPSLLDLDKEIEGVLQQVVKISDTLGASIVWLRSAVRLLTMWKGSKVHAVKQKFKKIANAIMSPLRKSAPPKHRKEEKLLLSRVERLVQSA